jgi:hypothetical protein
LIVMTNKVRQEINEHKLNTLLNDNRSYTSNAQILKTLQKSQAY